MKSMLLTAVLAAAAAANAPRISLDLTEARAQGVAVDPNQISNHVDGQDLGYDGSGSTPVLSRQDWTQRCPAKTSTEVTCPQPKASAYDHNNGVLDVTKRIYRINVDAVDQAAQGGTDEASNLVTTISYADRASYLIKFDAMDHSGNHAEQIVFALILDDTTNPSISLCMPAAQTVQANTAWTLCTSSTATDNIDSQTAVTGTMTYTIQEQATSLFLKQGTRAELTAAEIATKIDTMTTGEFNIVATAHDFAGVYGKPDASTLVGGDNSDTTSAKVTVVDTTAPIITVTGTDPAVSQCGVAYNDAGATASDSLDTNLATPLAIAVHPSNNVITSTVGNYWYKYNAADAHGNNAVEKTRVVQIRDTTVPTVTYAVGSGAVMQHAATPDNSLVDPGVVCADTCDQTTITATTSWGAKPWNSRVLGTYTRTYFCKDEHNNVGTIEREFNVVDEHSPVITIHGLNPVTLEASLTTQYADAGASCEDWHGGVRPVSTTFNFNGNGGSLNTPGTYYVSYGCTDAHNNIATGIQRTVVVQDKTCPQVTRLGKDTVNVEAGFEYHDDGATAWDNIDGVITSSVTETGNSVNTALKAQPGTYVITYGVTDAHGNIQCEDVKRTVVVSDTLPPVIVMRLSGTLRQVSDYTQTGIGGVHNNAGAGNYATNNLMAESAPTSSVNGWIVGAVASGVTGLALLAYGSK
jgi:hypothetical protein